MEEIEELEKHILPAKVVAVIGAGFVPLPTKLKTTVVRISCDVPRETLGPLLALASRVSFLTGETQPFLEQARSQLSELGRRVWGEGGSSSSAGTLSQLVHVANKLGGARSAACPVIVLDAADSADEATLEALKQIIEQPGWLRPALVLGFKSEAPLGLAGELLATVVRVHGQDAVVHAPLPRAPSSFSPTLLPTETRFIARAASVIGPAFELPLLAALVERPPLTILEHLQIARDVGLVLEDRGDGTFALDAGQAHALRMSMLPSLRTVLNRRAAELLSPPISDPPPSQPEIAIAPFEEEAPPAPEPAAPAPVAAEPIAAEPVAAQPIAAAPPPPPDPPAPPPPPTPPPPPAPAPPPPPPIEDPSSDPPPPKSSAEPRKPTVRSDPREVTLPNAARASEHSFESGDFDLAARRALLAASKAASLGAHAQAEQWAQRALEAAIRLPESTEAHQIRTRALILLGRVRLEGFAPTATFDLASALQPLEAAKRSLKPEDPPELLVEIGQLLAAAHCERGDLPSLEKAFAELTEMSRSLLENKHATLAARLLNDQAAVLLRMGDPVRAMALLEESRTVFEARPAGDPVALRELAETDHLIARIPLHVAARPGREDDALSRALDHAIAAKKSYERLGAARERARVIETMGRLELARGRLERAVSFLKTALDEQERLADLFGLARTASALSSALLAAERPEDALAMLGDAITLNHQKGSTLGVAFNRRAFDELVRGLGGREAGSPLVRQVRSRLEAAEADLGRIKLPGERDTSST
ncbi:MAG: hypothetical protein U0271_29170 [Polyangiaceae bacterium]